MCFRTNTSGRCHILIHRIIQAGKDLYITHMVNMYKQHLEGAPKTYQAPSSRPSCCQAWGNALPTHCNIGLICWQCSETCSEFKLKLWIEALEKPSKVTILTPLTSRLEMSIRTAKLVIWLHWQAMWLRFLENSSQPLEDQAPVPPILWQKEVFLTAILWSPLASCCYCSPGQISLHNMRGQNHS